MKEEFLPVFKKLLNECFGETCNLILAPAECLGEFSGYIKSTPSHRDKLLELVSSDLNMLPEELLKEYNMNASRKDIIEYLCDRGRYVAVYEHHSVGRCNVSQKRMLKDLIDCDYYHPYHKEI